MHLDDASPAAGPIAPLDPLGLAVDAELTGPSDAGSADPRPTGAPDPDGALGWGRWLTGWRAVSLVVAVAVLTHLPSLIRTEALNPDEGFLGTQAQVLNEGGQLYRDVVDRKPPVLPFLYAFTFRITGTESLTPIRVLALGAHIATALLLGSIARRRWGDRPALAAALLYLVASAGLVVEDGQAANFEVFMLPSTVLAFWLADRNRWLGAGLAGALTTLTKQVGATVLLPLAFMGLVRNLPSYGRVVRSWVLVGIGFSVPIVAAALAFDWRDFWFWVFTGNSGYLDPGGSWGQAFGRGMGSTWIFIGGNVGALLLAPVAWRYRRDDADVWLWLISGVIGVCAGFRFFGHYYFQIMPPVALLAAGALARRPTVWAWRRTAVVSTICALVFTVLAFTLQSPLIRPYARLASAIDALSTPTDRILVWGQFAHVYWASDRLPASRFLTAGFLTGFSGGRAEDQIGHDFAVEGAWEALLEDLVANPPALIVDTTAISDEGQKQLLNIERYPVLARTVRENYQAVTTVEKAVIYVHRPGAGTAPVGVEPGGDHGPGPASGLEPGAAP